MAITKDKKKEILNKLQEGLDKAKSLVFVHFRGLNVSNTTEMRRALREANVEYFVAKKTLIKRALDDKKFQGEIPELSGEVALAWGDDLVAPAREIYAFQKKNSENLQILGGVFEGKFMNQAEMMEIATIPPMPVLYGKFVNVINSPIQRFVIGLNEIAKAKN